jgi:hypothetical protein
MLPYMENHSREKGFQVVGVGSRRLKLGNGEAETIQHHCRVVLLAMIAGQYGARCRNTLKAQIHNMSRMAGAIGAEYPKTYPTGAARHGTSLPMAAR